MENKKKDLAKIAVAAFLLAASLPAASHAVGIESQEVLLAAGCGGGGTCGGGQVADTYGTTTYRTPQSTTYRTPQTSTYNTTTQTYTTPRNLPMRERGASTQPYSSSTGTYNAASKNYYDSYDTSPSNTTTYQRYQTETYRGGTPTYSSDPTMQPRPANPYDSDEMPGTNPNQPYPTNPTNPTNTPPPPSSSSYFFNR